MRLWPRRDRITLPERLNALEEVVATGSGRLPGDLVQTVHSVLDRTGERRELSVEHTVVALAGATGSGKSSLFNRIAGMEISRVGVRRPTTSEPLACVWGTQGVIPLLDWLGVPNRHRVARESVLDSGEADDLDGLVLLDLPDHDSTEWEHRATVDRLVEMVDLFVWVLDPQKYADAALHDRYLRPLSSHQAVTVVVLNQIDRLSRDEVGVCVADLRGLLDNDGLADVPAVALSTVTGEGMDALVDVIRTAVTKRRAVDERIEADVVMTAELVARAVGDGQPGDVGPAEHQRLSAALAEASGAVFVADAVGHSYLRRAQAATGWPLTRWMARFRANPLRRLGFAARRDPDVRLALVSLPEPTAVQRAQSDAAVREFGDTAAGSMAAPWRDSVRATAADSAARLPGALDRAVAATDFKIARKPVWWRVVNVLQWLALLTAVVGGLWLVALAGASFLRFDVPDVELAGFPAPTLLLVGGVVLGIVLAAGCVTVARHGSRRRARSVRKTLHELVDQAVAHEVVAPIEAEVNRYRAFGRALDRARLNDHVK